MHILAGDPVPSIRSANIEPSARSLRAGSANIKPVRMETQWRTVDPHLKQYCRDLAARLLDGDGQRQRAPKAQDRAKFELAVEVIVCNFAALAMSNAGDRSLAYIRANHATRISPVYGKPFNRAIELMVDRGLVVVEVGYRHDRWSRVPSSIARTAEFALPPLIGWEALRLEDHERLVVLHTDNDTGGSSTSPSMPPSAEREMMAINRHLCTAKIETGETVHIANWFSTITDQLITPYHRQLRRIFNDNYESGGRLYGGWWQTLPREQRKHIRIDGEPVVNVDFTTLHLRLAYAEARCESPPGDLYDVTGEDHLRPDWQTLREGRKRLVSVMLTSKRPLRQWPGGTPRERDAIKSSFGKGARVKDEVTAIRERHQAVAAWFECGRGLKLQRTESDILVVVLTVLNTLGITALPIHDSVLVGSSHGGTAQRIMEAEALNATGATMPAKINEV